MARTKDELGAARGGAGAGHPRVVQRAAGGRRGCAARCRGLAEGALLDAKAKTDEEEAEAAALKEDYMSLGKEIISARGDHRGQERDVLEEEQRKTMAAERAKRTLKSKAGEAGDAGDAGDALRSAQSLLEAALAGRSAAEEKVAGRGAGGQGGRRGPGKG